MCFCFNGNKKLSEDVNFNSNIKYGVDGDEVLKDSNLVCSFFYINLVYVWFLILLLMCCFIFRVKRLYLMLLIIFSLLLILL